MEDGIKLNFAISTPYGDAYNSEVDYLLCTTAEGDIGIRKNHENVMLLVLPGDIKISADKSEIVYKSEGGMLIFHDNNAVFVTAFAALASEYNEKRYEYLEQLEKRYSDQLKSEADLQRMKMAMHKSLTNKR